MNTLCFKPEFIPQVLDGTKCETRRLVKEGEVVVFASGQKFSVEGYGDVNAVYLQNGRLKFQVGAEVQVMVSTGKGRAQKAVWYCEGCGAWRDDESVGHFDCITDSGSELLKLRLSAIRKEKLLDITRENAKREGFKGTPELVRAFCEIYQIKYDVAGPYIEKGHESDIFLREDPDVWVLAWPPMKVKKDG